MALPRLVLSLCFIGCMATSASGQKVKKNIATEDWDKVFTKVEIEAGTNRQDWDSYMRKNAVLPASVARSIPSGTYKVLISFIIDINGSLQDIKADNDPGYGLAARALEVFKGYRGKWQPANQCGRLVKSYKKEPVIFVISE